MKKSIQDLLALQAADLRIRNLNTRYKTIPQERARVIEEFAAVKKAFAAAEAAVKKVEMDIRACQLENTTEQERLKNGKVRSGTVKKAAEYQAVLAEIAASEKKISDLETKELELLERLDQVNAECKQAEKNYTTVGRSAQKEVRELDQLKEKIVEEVKLKLEESKQLEKNVNQTILGQYRRMLSSGKGEPVSAISNEHCPQCNLHLTPMTMVAARKGDLVQCDHCSFFLYDPDAK